MATLEERFVELWNAGVKLSQIERELDIDPGRANYLRQKLNVIPRRDDEANKKLREEVWEMVLRRLPVDYIVAEKEVTSMYVRQTINKMGYSVRDFYDKPKRKKEEKNLVGKKGIKCTPAVMNRCIYGTSNCCMYCVLMQHRRPCPPESCNCYKRRPKNFKQKTWSLVK